MWDKSRTVVLRRHGSFVLGVLLIFVALFLFWFDSIRLPYIPTDFSHNAELLSVESTYNQENGRPIGGQLTYVTQSIQPSRKENNTVYLKNKLDVVTVDNKSLSSITREYGVAPQTGKSVSDQGESYLFAPKNIRKGSSFKYRHVTYDALATMNYTGQEKLFGLNTFRYEADYSTQREKLVKDVANPKLKPGQAEEYAPQLTLWIEPTTGWLIKYEEDTTVYLFEQNTKQRIAPVSHFTRIYTEESIKQHVNYARNLRYHILFGVEIVPGIALLSLILILSVVILIQLGITSIPVLTAAAFVLLTSGASLLGWILKIGPLMTLFSNTHAVNPVVGLCFMLVAICTVLIYRRLFHRAVAMVLGGLVAIIGALGVLGILGFAPFSIDLLLFPDRVLAMQEIIPARMALLQAFLFIIFGVLLAKGTLSIDRATAKVATFTASLTVIVGAIGLLVKNLALSDILATTFLLPLSTSTLILTLVSGLALLQALLNFNKLPTGWYNMARQLLQPALLCIPLILIGAFAHVQQENVKQQLRQAFTTQTDGINKAISDKVASYVNALNGAQALFGASIEVTNDEWQRFIMAIGLDKNYPGIENMGFIRLAPGKDPSWGDASYPALQRFGSATVVYGQADHDTSASEVGYNVFKDMIRTATLEEAVESGNATLSDKIALPQTSGHPPRDGFMLVLPVFKNGSSVDTRPERLQAVQGYVYLTFDATVLINNAHPALDKIDVDIYDGLRKDTSARIYGQEVQTYIPRLTRTNALYLGDHTWTVYYKARPTFQLQANEERAPSIILVVGSMLYLLILLVIYWFHMYRISQGKSGLGVPARLRIRRKRQ